jgi:hypothetical protein
MNRRPPQIVAFGGGGFSMEAGNALLDDFVLGLTSVERPRVCFCPQPRSTPTTTSSVSTGPSCRRAVSCSAGERADAMRIISGVDRAWIDAIGHIRIIAFSPRSSIRSAPDRPRRFPESSLSSAAATPSL